MCRQILVALLITGIFGDEVEVFAADDDGAVHFRGDNGAGEDTAADRDLAGEGAFLVCNLIGQRSIPRYKFLLLPQSDRAPTDVCALNSSLWSPES